MATASVNPDTPHTIHASCVAYAGRAVLITGASGSGKSGLALQLIAIGARLVADDRTALTRRGDRLIATAPEAIRHQIEARGIGILAARTTGPTPVVLVIDMDHIEPERLPPARETEILGITLPLQQKVNAPYFPAAILTYLEHGRIA